MSAVMLLVAYSFSFSLNSFSVITAPGFAAPFEYDALVPVHSAVDPRSSSSSESRAAGRLRVASAKTLSTRSDGGHGFSESEPSGSYDLATGARKRTSVQLVKVRLYPTTGASLARSHSVLR